MAALTKIHIADLNGRPPQIVVALTHVDQLPPAAEWVPPYNVSNPASPKEKVMRRAMESVAKTLGVGLDAIVPVAVPQGAKAWNTEFLWRCIAVRLDEAKLHKLTRLRQTRGGWSWSEAAGQAAHAASHIAGEAANLAFDYMRRFPSKATPLRQP